MALPKEGSQVPCVGSHPPPAITLRWQHARTTQRMTRLRARSSHTIKGPRGDQRAPRVNSEHRREWAAGLGRKAPSPLLQHDGFHVQSRRGKGEGVGDVIRGGVTGSEGKAGGGGWRGEERKGGGSVRLGECCVWRQWFQRTEVAFGRGDPAGPTGSGVCSRLRRPEAQVFTGEDSVAASNRRDESNRSNLFFKNMFIDLRGRERG